LHETQRTEGPPTTSDSSISNKTMQLPKATRVAAQRLQEVSLTRKFLSKRETRLPMARSGRGEVQVQRAMQRHQKPRQLVAISKASRAPEILFSMQEQFKRSVASQTYDAKPVTPSTKYNGPTAFFGC
ncbi:hypothetical protein BGZ67_000421, partial [Mortierella alpina]